MPRAPAPQRQTDGCAVVERTKDGELAKANTPLYKVCEEFDAALDATAIAHSFTSEDKAFGHIVYTEVDLLEILEPKAEGEAPEERHIAARLEVLRLLGRQTRLALFDAKASGATGSQHCRAVWDSLHKTRNRRRCSMVVAAYDLMDSGKHVDVKAEAVRSSPRKRSRDDDDDSGPSDKPPIPEDGCKLWYYTGQCKHKDKCRFVATHTQKLKGAGKSK
jgi:hypothetical protein